MLTWACCCDAGVELDGALEPGIMAAANSLLAMAFEVLLEAAREAVTGVMISFKGC